MERWSKFALVGIGILWAVLALAPELFDTATVRLLARMMVLGLLALSLNIMLGNTGIVSFGHGMFYGSGAYAISLFWSKQGWPALMALALTPFIAAGLAAIAGLVAFRARRLYFGLLTLAISQFGFVIAMQWYSMTQGENGIHGVELPDWLVPIEKKYWFIFGVFTVAAVLIRIIVASPFGTTLRAIRENRERVAFLGINALRYEYSAFIISGAFAGVAGGLLVILDQNSFPMLFHWTTSAEPLLMIVIGGAGSFLGPVLGAGVVVFVQDYLREVTEHINLLYGIVVLLIALGAPGGLSGIGSSLFIGGPRLLMRLVRRGAGSDEAVPKPNEPEVAKADWETPVEVTR
jgi:branched-chain amino acid transport system permease protein